MPDRKDQEVQDGPAICQRSIGQSGRRSRDPTAIGNGAVKDGLPGRADVRAQFGVDAVRGDHDLGLR